MQLRHTNPTQPKRPKPTKPILATGNVLVSRRIGRPSYLQQGSQLQERWFNSRSSSLSLKSSSQSAKYRTANPSWNCSTRWRPKWGGGSAQAELVESGPLLATSPAFACLLSCCEAHREALPSFFGQNCDIRPQLVSFEREGVPCWV